MLTSDHQRVEILVNSSSTICAELSNSLTKTKVNYHCIKVVMTNFKIQIKEICKYFGQEAIEA